MPFTILLTGFGPFPGAPFNPTDALVRRLARVRHPRLAGTRRIAHVFATRYDTVDRELPALIARERPAVVLMFGLAARTRHLRIETVARNTLSRLHADVGGHLPTDSRIAAAAPPLRAMRVSAQRLLAAARTTGVASALSRDAGSYLCNYLCWRASEAAGRSGGPRLVSFIHVPLVAPSLQRSGRSRVPRTVGDLVAAGEAILLAAVAAARGHH
jgi:pyroglutamyl-peptidase